MPRSEGSRVARARICPLAALAIASLAVAKSTPETAARSWLSFSMCWASSRLPVATTRLCRAGRSSSSETAVSRDWVEMKSSAALIWSSVAKADRRSTPASLSWAAASSMAALVDTPMTPASPAMAAVAGMAAFWRANLALAPAPSSCLNSSMARLMPLPSNSEMIGIVTAISESVYDSLRR